MLPLRLGHLAVVNRSQADLATHRSMGESRAAESQFFASHPVYAQVQLPRFDSVDLIHSCEAASVSVYLSVLSPLHYEFLSKRAISSVSRET